MSLQPITGEALRDPLFWEGVDPTKLIDTKLPKDNNSSSRKFAANILCRFFGFKDRVSEESFTPAALHDFEGILLPAPYEGAQYKYLPPVLPHKSIVSLIRAQVIFENGNQDLDEAVIVVSKPRFYVCIDEVEENLWVGGASQEALQASASDRRKVGYTVQRHPSSIPVGRWAGLTSRGSLAYNLHTLQSAYLAVTSN